MERVFHGSIMSQVTISYETFSLPFFIDPSDLAENDDDEDVDEDAARDLDVFHGLIPESAIFVGTVDSETSNWTSWEIEDHFYVIPWEDLEFDWALFRITWDDNWGCYQWSGDAKIKGVADPMEAARLMAKGAFTQWGIDFRSKENRPFQEFLENL